MRLTVNELIRKGREVLEAYVQQDAAIDARLLAMYVLGCDSAKLLLVQKDEVPDHIEQSYLYLIAKRAQGIPLQYITKEQPFMGLEFYVDERVLIPRQDTEVLVESILQAHQVSPIREAVEVGVGSGCISVALAHFMPEVHITAIDICDAALEVAKKNMQSNEVEARITLLQSDVFANYEAEEGTLDLIVSNPPYITTEECKTLMKEVIQYEPLKALTDGGDGLKFYRTITKEGKKWLKSGGLLAYEIGYLQGQDVCAILEAEGFEAVQIIQDLTHKDRVVLGRKK